MQAVNAPRRLVCLGMDILDRTQRTGIDRYYDELQTYMPVVADGFRFSLFALQRIQSDPCGSESRVKALSYSRRLANLGSAFGILPDVDRAFPQAALVHLLIPLPIRTEKPLVVTIHDITRLLTPKVYSWHSRIVFRMTLQRLVSAGAHFIVNSDCTGRDLSRLFDVPQARIHRVYMGVGEHFQPVQDTQQMQTVAKRYGLPERYFLFIGAMHGRKNLPTLLRAYARFVSQDDVGVNLVVAGRTNWGGKTTMQRINTLGLTKHVVFPGYIHEEDLPTVISSAVALVYPSLYEGFGFPALEAMACGTPVIATSSSALPETTGGHALLCDPHSVSQFAEAMLRVVLDNNLRMDLIQQGLEWSSRFSWEKTAADTARVYNYVLDTKAS